MNAPQLHQNSTSYTPSTGMFDDSLSLNIVMKTVQACPLNKHQKEAEIKAIPQGMAEFQPRDAAEGFLISQMTATYHHAMDMMKSGAKATLSDTRKVWMDSASRLMSLYLRQMETLRKYRKGGRQKMTVEHVHVHDGGQAIVGNVSGKEKGLG